MLVSSLQGFLPQALLPNEARILNPSIQRALTEKLLAPKLTKIETYLLVALTQLDIDLEALQPIKLGKPYPCGQFLEIAEAMHKRLGQVQTSELPSRAIAGYSAMHKPLREGGIFRQVWGELRGQYFQNASKSARYMSM